MDGPDLVDTGKKQAVRLGAEIKEETVQNVTPIEGGLSVVTDQGTYEASMYCWQLVRWRISPRRSALLRNLEQSRESR
ncbi:hypothetical protein GCM10010918_32340 [Paenibacillus radicis (ex Gao et al. 2016)]|uniref:Uncharacterized protein n=1 Tax=Paenibacillus radicis (ex Gao et al. 2016) TaxID=1737354 RepID=A0A917HAZ6_9BACL|nr:hypothetical protein GCM10010918_32340 [Paenibacillus radicis (ex Gao et al. 2016)]